MFPPQWFSPSWWAKTWWPEIGVNLWYDPSHPPPEATLLSSGAPLMWVMFTAADGTLFCWSTVSIVDDATYYGGFKESRVLSWGRIVRSLSDRSGQLESSDFSFTIQDTDRLMRGMLSHPTRRYVTNRPIVVMAIDDDARRARSALARTLVRGQVSGYAPDSDLTFSFTTEDSFSRALSQGTTPVSIPRRVFTTRDFPNLPPETVGTPVPIIYGKVSGYAVGLVYVSTVHLTLNGSIPVPYGAFQNDVSGGSMPDGRLWSYVTSISGGGLLESPPSNLAGSIATGRMVRVNWSRPLGGVAGVEKYRIYVFTSGPDGNADFTPSNPSPASVCTFCRYVEHDVATLDAYYPTGSDYSVVVNVNDGVDYLTGVGTVTQVKDVGRGLIRPVYVGTLFYGADFDVSVIAGHACAYIESCYVDTDVTDAAGLTSTVQVPVDLMGDTFITTRRGPTISALYQDLYNPLPPGQIPPTGAAPARRYDWIAARSGTVGGDALKHGKVSLNVWGIESVGDGTGTVIEDIYLQYRHCLQNWILNNYETGSWFPTPMAFNQSGPVINDASFNQASLVAQDRITGGYKGGFVLPASTGSPDTARDVIARFNVSADCDCGFDRFGAFFVSVFPSIGVAAQRLVAGVIDMSDANDVNQGSFRIVDDLDAHVNEIPYVAGPDYVMGTWTVSGAAENRTSQRNYNAIRTAALLELSYVRAALVADDIAHQRLIRQADPPRTVTLTTGLQGANYELGDIIQLTHYGGISGSGYVGQPLRLIRIELDPNLLETTLTFTDLQPLIDIGLYQNIPHGDVMHGDTLYVNSIHTDILHQDISIPQEHVDTDVLVSRMAPAVAAAIPDAVAAPSGRTGHGDIPHGDGHVDVTHVDVPHVDVPHNDTLHVDVSGFVPHLDVPHVDTDHLDVPATAHVDSGLFADVAHQDGGIGHADCPHEDVTHVDAHQDEAHLDLAPVRASHQDEAHTDISHQDGLHQDVPFADIPHADTVFADGDYVRTHYDLPHDDHDDGAVHSDIWHVDLHGDTAFGDVPHADAPPLVIDHVDAPHSDIVHTDFAHGDLLHVDVPAVAVAHSDHVDGTHADVPHNDCVHEDAPHDDLLHADHNDLPHVDVRHGDYGHGDVLHVDHAHFDIPHADHY